MEVQIEQVRYKVGRDARVVLDNFDLHVPSGRYCALVGPSGAGKSSVLELVSLLARPSSGKIYLNGSELGRASDHIRSKVRRESLGIQFQGGRVFPTRTVGENLALASQWGGLPPDPWWRATSLLDQAQLNVPLEALAGALSGGERARLSLLMAIVTAPALLLCDEPVANLDAQTADIVLGMIDAVNRRGTTVIVVAHDDKTSGRAMMRVHLSLRTAAVP